MIELSNVGKAQDGKPILETFNLKVKPGERVILFGPSGSGKTTILRLIAGFLAPDRGAVSLNGQVASKDGRVMVPPHERGLGFVFQDLALWPHMTVFENVEFALKVQRVNQAQRVERVEAMLALVQLSSFKTTYPAKLSGGEQQRVAIARALIAEPSTVLMDEPLSNLDEDLRTSLCTGILEFQARFGFTLVYVTHNRDEIRMLDGRVVQLEMLKPKTGG